MRRWGQSDKRSSSPASACWAPAAKTLSRRYMRPTSAPATPPDRAHPGNSRPGYPPSSANTAPTTGFRAGPPPRESGKGYRPAPHPAAPSVTCFPAKPAARPIPREKPDKQPGFRRLLPPTRPPSTCQNRRHRQRPRTRRRHAVATPFPVARSERSVAPEASDGGTRSAPVPLAPNARSRDLIMRHKDAETCSLGCPRPATNGGHHSPSSTQHDWLAIS